MQTILGGNTFEQGEWPRNVSRGSEPRGQASYFGNILKEINKMKEERRDYLSVGESCVLGNCEDYFCTS